MSAKPNTPNGKTKDVGNKKPKFVRVPAFVSTYSNNAQLRTSNWDVSCVFGEIVGEESAGAPIIEQRVSVVMSPQHAKAFLRLLQENIRKYEEAFGEIKWQPEKPAAKSAATPSL